MSEQFANLANSTLAAGYTAGSGSITVASASGFPTQGTFTLVIQDQNTKAIKLLFRVTGVTGAVFSGAAEGTDAAANLGDLVAGTMITTAAMNQIKADILASVPPSSGFIQNLTAPVAANFTQQNFNVGSGVVTTQANNTSPVTSISLKQHDPSNTQNMVALDKAKLAATFTITAGLSMCPSGFSNQSLVGLWLSDGGAGPNNLFLCRQSNVGLRIPVFTSFTAFSGDVIQAFNTDISGSPLMWFRIQETASARIYSLSTDGVLFVQVFTESNTAHFTTARYGFAVSNRSAGANAPDAMATLYSFSESTP
jgi:hypothetical protein